MLLYTSTSVVGGVEDDTAFDPLWRFIVDQLGLALNDVTISKDDGGGLNNRFVIVKGANEDSTWSNYGMSDLGDNASDISFMQE